MSVPGFPRWPFLVSAGLCLAFGYGFDLVLRLVDLSTGALIAADDNLTDLGPTEGAP